MSGMKSCSRCGESKELGEFHKTSSQKSGLSPHCMVCEKARYERRKEDPTFLAKKRVSSAKSHVKCKDRIKETRRKYYQNNKDSYSRRTKTWIEENKPLWLAIQINSQAKGRARISSELTGPGLYAWLCDQEKTCFWCGVDCSNRFEIDHFIPISMNGVHETHNLVISCVHCNRTKHSTDPAIFAERVGKTIVGTCSI